MSKAPLTPIHDIANGLYTENDIDFTRTRVEPGTCDSYEGYVNALASGAVIEYSAGGSTLTVQEIVGTVPDEDGDPTDEEHTLGYLWATCRGDEQLSDGEAHTEDELRKIITDFMGK